MLRDKGEDVNTKFTFTQVCSVTNFVERGILDVLEKILNFVYVFFTFSLLSPLAKRYALYNLIFITQGCIVPCLVEIGPVVRRRKLKDFIYVFSLFHYYFPFKVDWVSHLNKLESYSSKDDTCQIWLKLADLLWIRREKRKVCRQMDAQKDGGRRAIRKVHYNFSLGELKVF